MSDLISRKDAIEAITNIDTTIIPFPKAREYVEIGFKNVINRLKKLPSAEPERNAKVAYRSTTMGLSFCCGNCGKPVHSEGEYCHHCGARLEWE